MSFSFFRFLGARIIGSLPLALIVSAMIFGILRLLPADPIAMLLPPNATIADAARLRQMYGLDDPIYVQYWRWLAGMARGDFGESIHLRQPVGLLLAKTLPASIDLVAFSALIGVLAGVLGGVGMFLLRGTKTEIVGEVATIAILSLPEFLWGIFLLLLFGVTLTLLPFMGRFDSDISFQPITGFLLIDTLLTGRTDALKNGLAHLILPALALGVSFAPIVMRVVRASLLANEHEDYVVFAAVRGVSPARILINHQLRNAALPTVSLIGVQVAFLFGGTMLIEVIYSYPGLGNLMVEAVRAQDLPLIQGVALTYCTLVLLLNALTDASYQALNPKLRRRTS